MPGTKIAEDQRREQIVAAAYALATKRGLRAITIRDVARKARISVGLVLFHFGTKDRVVLALLDWVIANTVSLSIGPEIVAMPDPLDRLIAVIRHEMKRLAGEPNRNRLFLEFWSEGIWNRPIRIRMQRDLDGYRAAIRAFVAAALDEYPDRFGGVDVDVRTTALVSFLKGCAVQSTIQADIDVDAMSLAAERLLLPPAVHA